MGGNWDFVGYHLAPESRALRSRHAAIEDWISPGLVSSRGIHSTSLVQTLIVPKTQSEPQRPRLEGSWPLPRQMPQRQ